MAAKTRSRPAKDAKVSSGNGKIQAPLLMKLLVNELKDIYWAEKALVKALPAMAKKITDPKLLSLLDEHLTETQNQVEKLENIFELLGQKTVAKKCEAMAGLIKESSDIVKGTEQGAQRDAGIISAVQKIEHYEIASYGTLRAFAKTLGLEAVAGIFDQILEEEKNADRKLSEIAAPMVSAESLEEEEAEE